MGLSMAEYLPELDIQPKTESIVYEYGADIDADPSAHARWRFPAGGMQEALLNAG
jgi:hypothetical protein